MLKEQGIIGESEYLSYAKTDWNPEVKVPKDTSGLPQTATVTYELFSQNGSAIDKSICDSVPVQVDIPLNTSLFNMTEYQMYADKGFNIFDPQDKFFMDRCVPVGIDSAEATIQGRRKLYANVSLSCSGGCVMKGINSTTGFMICDCNMQSKDPNAEIGSDIASKLLKTVTTLNLEICKCWENVIAFVFIFYIT